MTKMPAAEPRYCIAQVVEETRDAWRDFCDANAINRTVLADIIGIWLRDAPTPLPPQLAQMVEDARTLQNQRLHG